MGRKSQSRVKNVRFERLIDRPDCVETLAEWLLGEWPDSVSRSRADAVLNIAGRTNFNRLPLAIVALDDGVPIGMASLAQDRPPAELQWQAAYVPCLATLYVLPTYRGRGIGEQLCDCVAGEASRLGYRELFLYTETAADFYQARGWELLTSDTPAFMRRGLA